jgi:hypothetical protein
MENLPGPILCGAQFLNPSRETVKINSEKYHRIFDILIVIGNYINLLFSIKIFFPLPNILFYEVEDRTPQVHPWMTKLFLVSALAEVRSAL